MPELKILNKTEQSKLRKKIFRDIFSKDKKVIHQALIDIKILSKKECDILIEKIFNNYDPNDKENVKITIRALNKCLWDNRKIGYIKRFGEILLQNAVNLDGYTRMIVNSVTDTYRLLFITRRQHIKKELELEKYSIEFYAQLAKLYKNNTDKKIKSSILSCLSSFNSLAFREIIEKTKYKRTYEKFSQLSYKKRYEYDEDDE